MVGSAYPFTVPLDDSGLATILTSGTPFSADKLYWYDNGAVIILDDILFDLSSRVENVQPSSRQK